VELFVVGERLELTLVRDEDARSVGAQSEGADVVTFDSANGSKLHPLDLNHGEMTAKRVRDEQDSILVDEKKIARRERKREALSLIAGDRLNTSRPTGREENALAIARDADLRGTLRSFASPVDANSIARDRKLEQGAFRVIEDDAPIRTLTLHEICNALGDSVLRDNHAARWVDERNRTTRSIRDEDTTSKNFDSHGPSELLLELDTRHRGDGSERAENHDSER